MSICYLLVWELLPGEGSTFADNPLASYPTSMGIVIARFFCGIILHMSLQEELYSGLDKMKFSLNHHYRFENYLIAFLSGLLQTLSILAIEVVNFIMILTTQTYLDVVMNFMALLIISEFDDSFYSALGKTPVKEIIETPENYEDLYKITRTSCRFASATDENKNEDDTVPASMEKNDYFGITFVSRGPVRMALRLIYKVFRVLLISLWFYFMPFVAMLGSYLVPYFIRTRQQLA